MKVIFTFHGFSIFFSFNMNYSCKILVWTIRLDFHDFEYYFKGPLNLNPAPFLGFRNQQCQQTCGVGSRRRLGSQLPIVQHLLQGYRTVGSLLCRWPYVPWGMSCSNATLFTINYHVSLLWTYSFSCALTYIVMPA